MMMSFQPVYVINVYIQFYSFSQVFLLFSASYFCNWNPSTRKLREELFHLVLMPFFVSVSDWDLEQCSPTGAGETCHSWGILSEC